MPKCERNGKSELWTAEQFRQVAAELNPNMRALFSICYYTGCRISEARQLRAESLVGDTIVFKKITTKTKRTRSVPMHSTLKTILSESNLPTTGYLFPGREKDKPISRQACDKSLRRACDYLGLEGFSSHSNRRTWATRLDRAGVRMKAIKELGGWSSMAALQRYLDVSEAEMAAAIEVLD
ncbi:site-specific recombinase XerD [Leptolyngbya sp. PCC 7375]|nr:site-specific recombinase XerD [Leptolyngbya sp. PCC 7375]